MRGRKPDPTRLKVVKGNPGGRPLSADEPEPPMVEADTLPPEWLSPEAREHWPEVAKHLRDAKILTVMDVTALSLYCEAFARWRAAQAEVAANGMIVYSAKSGFPVQSPYVSIANAAWAQMLKILVEFGMTPSSRTRVKTAKGIDPAADEYREFRQA